MNRGRPRKFDEQEALAAAMDVFWRRGYEGASIEELLEAMGLNAGSLYSTFGDKSTLFEKAFSLYERTVFSHGTNVLNQDGSPLENIRELVRCWADFMSHPDCKGCLVSTTVIDFKDQTGGVGDRARKLIRSVQKIFEKKLAQAKQAGELSAEKNVKDLAAFLITTAQGLTVMSRAGAGKTAIQGVVNTTLMILT